MKTYKQFNNYNDLSEFFFNLDNREIYSKYLGPEEFISDLGREFEGGYTITIFTLALLICESEEI